MNDAKITMMARFSQTKRRGFTLIEILVVIAIVAILLLIATPSMARFIADWRAKDAANSLIGQLRLARIEAIRKSRPVILCPVNAAGTACNNSQQDWKGGWLLFVDNDNNGAFSEAAGDKLMKKQGPLLGLAEMQKSQTGALVFWPTGVMRLSNGTSRFSIASSYQEDGQSAIQNYYCVGSTGRVRKLAPNKTAC